jgi:hypothetical protein
MNQTNKKEIESINNLVKDLFDATKKMCYNHGSDPKLFAIIATAYCEAILSINDIINPNFKDTIIELLNEEDLPKRGMTLQ